MKINWKQDIQRLHSFLSKKLDKKAFTFLICLLIATVLWFLNALNKDYTVDILYPIKYVNLPKDKVVTNTPAKNFALRVNAGGFAILRHKMSLAFTPLVIDIDDLPQAPLNNDSIQHLSIPTRSLERKISSQVSNELSVISILPDSIRFDFDQLIERKVKVVPDISYTLAKQHYLSDSIYFTPDSVLVKAPSSILDTIKYVKTQAQSYDDLAQSIKRNVSLVELENITINPKRVVMNIPIEEFTEKKISIPIQVINIPDSLDLKLFPNKTNVSFLVGINHFADVTADDFKIVVDYNEMSDEEQMLNVKIFYQPSNLYGLRVSTEQVEYLLQNKHTDD